MNTYTKELGLAMLLYAAVLVGSIAVATRMDPGPLQAAVVLTPMLPFLLALRAILRNLRRVDEFVRKSTLEHVAVAAAVTAALTFSYGFLEGLGYPRLSMFVVWPLMGAVWFVACMVHTWRHR